VYIRLVYVYQEESSRVDVCLKTSIYGDEVERGIDVYIKTSDAKSACVF
jgi:hypothetical protein